MGTRQQIKLQKAVLVEIFGHARAYTNVIMVAGFAGIFALWSSQAQKITPITSLSVGLLLALSLIAFVGWEIYGMVQRFNAMQALRRSIDNPRRYAEEIGRYAERAQLLMRSLERAWHPVIWIAVLSAASAMLILVSAFCHGLYLDFAQSQPDSEGYMEYSFLSIVIGGFLAGLCGFLVLRLEAWRNNKASRRALAVALESDLRSCVLLYSEVISTWRDSNYVPFLELDQIDFVRNNFHTDRPHLSILKDEDIRLRLLTHFRESYPILMRLRRNQENLHSVGETDPDNVASLRNLIQTNVDMLKDHQSAADEIANQLKLRFIDSP